MPVGHDDLEQAGTEHVAAAEYFASYIRDHKLYYGKEASRPSWAVALNTYELPSERFSDLSVRLAGLISEFVVVARTKISDYVRESALSDTLPPELLELWLSLKRSNPFPFCVRPDVVVDREGRLVVLEFNVDSRLDRGLALGVTTYSKGVLSPRHRLLAHGLIDAYTNEIKRISGAAVPNVGILVSNQYRQAYRLQEEYFWKQFAGVGEFNCHVVDIMDLEVNSEGVRRRGEKYCFDVVIPEVELCDDLGRPHLRECSILTAISRCSHTIIVGSLLPYADKRYLVQDRQSDGTSGACVASTSFAYQIGEPRLLAAHESEDHFVLKRTGVASDTTESKGVVICCDVSPSAWQAAVQLAFACPPNAWVVQPLIRPMPYRVLYRKSVAGKTREANAYIRLSLYYVRTSPLLENVSFNTTSVPQYELAGALATAGTDREMLRRNHYKIRALRHCALMAVTMI